MFQQVLWLCGAAGEAPRAWLPLGAGALVGGAFEVHALVDRLSTADAGRVADAGGGRGGSQAGFGLGRSLGHSVVHGGAGLVLAGSAGGCRKTCRAGRGRGQNVQKKACLGHFYAHIRVINWPFNGHIKAAGRLFPNGMVRPTC